MRRGEKFVTMVDGARMFAMAVASLFLLAGTATAAHAADVAAPAAPPLFDTLDVNKDQVLSRQEFQSGYAGLQPPHDAFWGARYAIIEDPDGIAVGLMSPISPDLKSVLPDL